MKWNFGELQCLMENIAMFLSTSEWFLQGLTQPVALPYMLVLKAQVLENTKYI